MSPIILIARTRSAAPSNQRGVTLIELMVALVLGLIVTGAALALFATNRQTYVASEDLGRIQEASRAAFELMTRDLREADGNPCSNEIRLTNQLNDFTTYAWWSDWGAGLRGYTGAQALPDVSFGTTAGTRVAGTPAVELWTARPTGILVDAAMATTGDDLEVTSTVGRNVNANDILVICDYSHGTIFQASGVTADTIKHESGGSPGNVDGNLPPNVYGPNAVISRLHAVRWYVANTGRTDPAGNPVQSLFRTSLNGAGKVQTADEIVEGVSNMVLEYHVASASSYTTSPADWNDVDAIRVSLTMTGGNTVGTDGEVLERTFDNVVALRSRAQ